MPPVASTTAPAVKATLAPDASSRAVNAEHAALVDDEIESGDVLGNRDRGLRFDGLDERAQDCVTGRIAAGFDDAAPLMRRFTPEREFAGVVAIERGAEFEQFFDPRGRIARENFDDRFVADAGAGPLRVDRVKRGRIVLADRCRNAALRPIGRRAFSQSRLAEHGHRHRREFQRGHEPGDACAHNQGAAAAFLHGRGAQSRGCRLSSSMRSTERRARSATSGAIVTSNSIASSECSTFGSVLRFMCGQRLHGRTKSTDG